MAALAESFGDVGRNRNSRPAHLVRQPELLPIRKRFRQPVNLQHELMRAALARAVWSERQLYEVMVQFWSDHFNIDPSKGDCKWLKVADDRDVGVEDLR